MTREELINLVKELYNSKGETEEDRLLSLLEKNVPHPEVSDLIILGRFNPRGSCGQSIGLQAYSTFMKMSRK